VRQEFITPITLILHEWATNAVKHGVLGAVDGQLSVQWEADTASLVLTWAEHREVEVGQLDRQGFGTVLLSTAARQLRATLDTDGDGHTLRHRLKMPISLGDYE
jgi:two-component system CheB/CheR fusion protein